MATKLHGMLNLSKIDKSLISTNAKGEKVIWIDVVENRNGADQYGNTHAVTIYNRDTRQTTYLGNLKPQEFGNGTAAPADTAAQEDPEGDLPF